ncbi:uncharacterized protein [Argopecten irradians]|uniref:uncharacterized protein n=1 Tax=Argopecten irradians TaxID=31199 RepID=UPI0037130B7C
MASKRSICRARVHVPDMCAICQSTEDINWYCNDCLEILCDKCKDGHKRGRKTRNDNVVPIKEANKQGETIISEVCKTHPGKSCDLYCSECEVIMCASCFTQKHKQHAFKTIEEEIISQQMYIQNELDTLRSEVDQSDTKVTQNKQDTKSFEDNVHGAIKEIESMRSELKSQIDSVADSAVTELSSLLKEVKETQVKDYERSEKNIQEMRKLIQAVEEEMKPTPQISFFFELTKKLQTAKSLYKFNTESVVPRPPHFVPGTFERSQLESMFGYIQIGQEVKDVARYKKRQIDSTRVKQTFTFRVPQKKKITSICPIDDKHAWISVVIRRCLILVNNDGQVMETIKLDFNPGDLTLTNTGGLLMTDESPRALIYHLSEVRRVTTFADVSPLCACYVSVSDNDEVVVSTDSPTILVLNKSGNKVRQLSCGGKGLSIVCLTTGHVAVVVYKPDDDDRRELVIKDQSDNTLYTWSGELDKDEEVSGMGFGTISRDMYNRVFVPDFLSQQVLVVSGDHKTACLLDEGLETMGPTAVGVDRCGHVWIGHVDGTVRVMEL